MQSELHDSIVSLFETRLAEAKPDVYAKTDVIKYQRERDSVFVSRCVVSAGFIGITQEDVVLSLERAIADLIDRLPVYVNGKIQLELFRHDVSSYTSFGIELLCGDYELGAELIGLINTRRVEKK